jgi:hypothetical protein
MSQKGSSADDDDDNKFDTGKLLDRALGIYQTVSMARVNRDTARYNAAGAAQVAALHEPQAYGMLEAYGIGNAKAGSSINRPYGNGSGGNGLDNKLLIGGLVLVVGFFALKVLK